MLKNHYRFIHSLISGYLNESFGSQDPWLQKNKNAFQGETCFIFGNGPSLKDFQFKEIEGFKSFGVNGIFLKYTPSFYVSISSEFFKNHISSIEKLESDRKFIGNTIADNFANYEGSILNCHWGVKGAYGLYNFPRPFRFSKSADRLVYLGGTVISVCLQISFFLGFSRVILAGVDHKFGFPRSEAVYGGRKLEVTGSDDIHFDSNYNPVGHITNCDMIATERSFKLAFNTFRKDGREIWNVTPSTALDVIPKAKLEDLL